MPNLSDPLGAPKIITGVEYMDALARLGYNVENMSSPLPTMTKIAQGFTSLIDNNYDQAMKWQKSQADSQEAIARAKNIDSATDYNNQALDLRLKDLDLQNKQRQQGLDFASDAHPIQQKILENQGKSSDLAIQQAERSVNDQNEALNMVPQATSELPNPDDPDYLEKRDQWRIKYNRLLTNPATKARMEGEYQAIDGVYQGKILTQQTVAKRKEFSDLQMGGFIPSVINPDAAMRSPDSDTLLTRGRMLQARQQIEMLASELPDGDPAKDRLQTIINEADTHTKSDTGVQDIMAGKSSVFDTNGRLTGTALGAAQQAQARATQLGTAAKPETQLQIGVGTPQMGKYPGTLTIKGVTPEVGQQLAEKYGLAPPQPAQPAGAADARFLSNIQDPQIRSIGERLQRKEITYDQAIEQMKQIKQPAPIRQPGMPAGAAQETGSTMEAPSTTQVNPDQPLNARFNNPGAMGLTKSALKFGATPSGHFDTGHAFAQFPTREAGAAAQFSMWQNSALYKGHTLADAITNWIGPGEHGEAEFIAKTLGIPLNTVISDEFLRSSMGIRLMQAQAQYEGQNVLTPEQWKRAQDWAYNGIKPSGTPAASHTLANAALPRPRTVEEAQALPPGTHFIDPEGNRRMVA